jgi:hypothetical protein
MKKRYCSIVILGIVILILPLEWYTNLKVDPRTFTVLSTSGVQAMLDCGMRMGMIFLLTIVVQGLSLKCNSVIYAVLAKILFGIVLITYPMVVYEMKDYAIGIMIEFYSTGFYLAILIICASILADLISGRRTAG